jgi:hypothetical protein
MVQSKITQVLQYPETAAVHSDDRNKELSVYETKVYSLPVSICLGKIQENYSSYGVLYVPIYLVKPNGRVTRIGVYEFRTSKFKNLRDVTGEEELDFDKLQREKPLLYEFATIDYISGILHGLEKHKLDIDQHLLSTLQEQEKISEEYERILKQETESKKAQAIAASLRNQYDLVSSTPPSAQQIYRRNKSRKNRPSASNL